MRISGVRKWIALAGGVLIGVFAFAGAASAHVTVSPNVAPQDSVSVVAFRVPTESDTASTVKVDVNLDMTHPVASVIVAPVPGWTAKVTTTKLAKPLTDDDGDQVTEGVSEIVWTADSAATAIKPGEFDEFPIELGPLPETGSLTFKVLQTYSDGSVVRWIDPTPPGGPEPEHPAPVLSLTAASGDGAAIAPPGVSVVSATSAAPEAATSSKSNSTATTLGIIGAILGLVGAVLGGAAYARTRGPAPTDPAA